MSTYPILFIPSKPRTLHYKGKGFGKSNFPQRDRNAHGNHIAQLLEDAWQNNTIANAQMDHGTLPAKKGIYLEIKGAAQHDLAIESLDSSGMRLLHVNTIQDAEIATVFIPEEKKPHFVKKIQEYTSGELTPRGKPQNTSLVSGIEEIYMANLASFWTDAQEDMPQNTPVWCEVWLEGNGEHIFQDFVDKANQLDIECNTSNCLQFPERTVALAKVNREKFHQLLIVSSCITECRLAREPAAFFTDLAPREQADWVKDFLQQATFAINPHVSVCILDSGVNNGHPLLKSILHNGDMHAFDAAWGTHDHLGHGTGMAGIATYGDVAGALAASTPVRVHHCLESTKILPPRGRNPKELYGLITASCIAKAMDAAPERKRQICMAITAPSSPFAHRGEPTSWSAALDNITAGAHDINKYLMLVSAGNIREEIHLYPDNNLTQMIEDPAQAWNVLTVGAYTNFPTSRDPLPDDIASALAPRGGLSPHSRTSTTWQTKWPYKPDVMFEGGNMAVDHSMYCLEHDALSVLTTSHDLKERLLTNFNATSAATAEAAWFAAQIQLAYPEAWPETIRALMVHSADWTPAMRQQFAPQSTKTELARLKRICGYGVPSLERALHCMNNSLVLVAEREFQPYSTERDAKNKKHDTMQMHLFELPWPKEALEELGGVKVTMRVTLSYFIEPNPNSRGWKGKYRYASHGLRFDVQGRNESEAAFLKRIRNIVEDEKNEESENTSRARSTDTSARWDIGKNGRSSGSIHSDFLTDSGATVAAYGKIAVFPVVGWWREQKHLGKSASKARYSLIVSLHTEAQDVDIYTPVKVQIDTAVKTPVSIPV